MRSVSHTLVLTFLVLHLLSSALGCDAADPDDPTVHGDATGVAGVGHGTTSGTMYAASGNLWVGDSAAASADFLDRLEGVGLGVARVGVRGVLARGLGGNADDLREKLIALQARGLHAYLRTNVEFYEAQATPVRQFYDSGFRLRVVAADYPGVVVGAGAFNEANLRYRMALQNGQDARWMIPMYLKRAAAFSEGWKAAEFEHGLDPLPVLTPAMGRPFDPASAPWWEALRPRIADGTFDGIDIHLHTSYREYNQNPPESYAERVRVLYARHGLTGTMTFVGEAGCRNGVGGDVHVSPEEHGACYALHLANLALIPEARMVNVWTVDRDGGMYTVDPDGPTGLAVREWAQALSRP
jgi:hypothetical protein